MVGLVELEVPVTPVQQAAVKYDIRDRAAQNATNQSE
jgi:hypothetical protein